MEAKSPTKTVYGDPDCAYRDSNGDPLDVDGDGISDYDEVDPRRTGAAQAVKDFVALHGDNETLMNNTFQQFVRDEMLLVIRGFDPATS